MAGARQGWHKALFFEGDSIEIRAARIQ